MSPQSTLVRRSDGVYDAVGARIAVDGARIDELIGWARAAVRQRARICMHESAAATVHEMLIAICRSSYIPPHRHTGKVESFHVIHGCADVVFFDDAGNIEAVERIAAPGGAHPFYLSIRNEVWHTLLLRSDEFVIHEVTNGPFVAEATELASWAPAEADRPATLAYLEELDRRITNDSLTTHRTDT